MSVQFTPATKHASRLRLALAGPAGSGKTYSALAIAAALPQPVAVIDTERGSASKYSDLFKFSTLELESFHPDRYIEAIHAAAEAGFETLVIDSLSHAWMGKDGALELVDRAAKRAQTANSFGAWREVTPLHNALVDAMIGARLHLIVTLRSKTEYVQEKDDKGRTVIRKMGMAPVQRDGLEYEFDVYGDLDQDNNLIVGKTRCPALAGQIIRKPGAGLAATLTTWLQGAPDVQHSTHVPPTRERDVDDADRVTKADEEPWRNWLKVRDRAEALGLLVQDIRLPVVRHELKAVAGDVILAIKAREAEQQRNGAAAGRGSRS
jgi:hypothetical protein